MPVFGYIPNTMRREVFILLTFWNCPLIIKVSRQPSVLLFPAPGELQSFSAAEVSLLLHTLKYGMLRFARVIIRGFLSLIEILEA